MPLAGEGVDVGGAQMRRMVDRGRPQLDGETDPGPLAELVAVNARDESGRDARRQDGVGLIAVEGTAFAEHVDPLGVGRADGDHLVDHHRDVVVDAARVLRGRDVRGEQGHLVGELAGDARAAQLVAGGLPVPGLALDGGAPGPGRFGHQSFHIGGEHLVGGLPGGFDGGSNAARRVALAGHPRRELLGALTGEDQVRVAFDEAGQDRTSADVVTVVGGGGRRGVADPDHAVGVEDDRGVPDDAERAVAEGGVVGHQHTDTGQCGGGLGRVGR